MPIGAAALSLIGTGVTAATSGAKMYGQKKADERYNYNARLMQDRADTQNTRFWNLQNDYNHPSAQMSRLREAGLNPNLVYGQGAQGATGHAEQINSSKAPDVRNENYMQDIGSHAANAGLPLQWDNVRAQNTVLEQQALLTAAQTAKTTHEGDLLQPMAVDAYERAMLNFRQLAGDAQYSQQRGFGEQLRTNIVADTSAAQIDKMRTEANLAAQHLKGAKLENRIKQLELNLKNMGIEKGDPAYLRIMTQLLNKSGVLPENFNK